MSSLRQEIPTQYWDSSVVLRGLQSVVFTAWSPAGEWDPCAQAVARKTCLAGSWGVVLNHTRSLAYTHLDESHFWCFLNHSRCFHTLGVSLITLGVSTLLVFPHHTGFFIIILWPFPKNIITIKSYAGNFEQKCRHLAEIARFGPNLAVYGPKIQFFGGRE